jgi:hypothetical protein
MARYPVQKNARLQSLDGFQLLRLVQKLTLLNNTALSDISALSSMTQIDDTLSIQQSPRLSSLAALAAVDLSRLRVLSLLGTNLTTLDGLGKVRHISNLLEIKANPVLRSLGACPCAASASALLILRLLVAALCAQRAWASSAKSTCQIRARRRWTWARTRR